MHIVSKFQFFIYIIRQIGAFRRSPLQAVEIAVGSSSGGRQRQRRFPGALARSTGWQRCSARSGGHSAGPTCGGGSVDPIAGADGVPSAGVIADVGQRHSAEIEHETTGECAQTATQLQGPGCSEPGRSTGRTHSGTSRRRETFRPGSSASQQCQSLQADTKRLG